MFSACSQLAVSQTGVGPLFALKRAYPPAPPEGLPGHQLHTQRRTFRLKTPHTGPLPAMHARSVSMTPDCPPTCPQSASVRPLAGPQLALPPGLRAGGTTGRSTSPAPSALIGQSVAAGLSEKEQLAKALRLSVQLATQISAEEVSESIEISNGLTASALDAEARAEAIATEVADLEAATAVSTRQAACASTIDQRDEAVLAAGLSASRLSADAAEALETIDAVKAVSRGGRPPGILASGRVRAEPPPVGVAPTEPVFAKVRSHKLVRIASPAVTATTAAKVLTAAAAAAAVVGMDCASVPFGPAMEAGEPLPWLPTLDLRAARMGTATVLFPVCLAASPTSAPGGVATPPTDGLVFGYMHEDDTPTRDDAVSTAKCWLPPLVVATSPVHSWLAGELTVPASGEPPGGGAGGLLLRIVIAPFAADVALPRAPGSTPLHRWVSPGAIRCEAAALAAGSATYRALTFVVTLPPSPWPLQVGRGDTRAVRTGAAPLTSLGSTAHALGRCERATLAMRAGLAVAAHQHPDPHHALFLARCAERVLPVPVQDIPGALLTRTCRFDYPPLRWAPFGYECPIPRTSAKASPPPHPPGWPPGLTPPARQVDMLMPLAAAEMFDHLDALDAHFAACAAGADPSVGRPPGRAWGVGCFRPEFRSLLLAGAVVGWDAVTGVPFLWPPDHHLRSHVSAERAAVMFAASDDQEAVSWLTRGIPIPIGCRAPCVALSNNLLSCYPPSAARPIAEQLAGFHSLGWSERGPPRSRAQGCLGLPSLPFESAQCGGVAKRGTTEPRIIINLCWPQDAIRLGFPGYPLRFAEAPPDGHTAPAEAHREWYYSTNALTGSAKPFHGVMVGPWQRDFKPSAAVAMRNTCVLGHVCELAGLDIFELSFDFKKWFHQLWYRCRGRHIMGVLAPALDGEGALRRDLVAQLNLVMAMGWSAASGIAQRVLNIVIRLVALYMDVAEAPHRSAEPEAVRSWLADRTAIPHSDYGRHDRLFFLACFADDPRFVCAGSAVSEVQRASSRVERLAICFNTVVGPAGLNLMLADQVKWSVCTWSRWIGICQCPLLGIVWIPPEKALRADAELATLARGEMALADFVSLLGFINHLAGILLAHPYTVRVLWKAHDRTVPLGAAALVRINRRERVAVETWRRIVMNTPGTDMMRAVIEDPAYHDGGRSQWVLRADACFDVTRSRDGLVTAGDKDPPGMGANFFGRMWTRVLSSDELQFMTIPVAEFMASVANLFAQEEVLEFAEVVVLEIDARASPDVLVNRAKGDALAIAHEEFMADPIFARFTSPPRRLLCRHIFGPANPSGDACSRSRPVLAEQLARQLGIDPVWLQLPPGAVAYFDRVFARIVEGRTAKLLAAALAAASPQGAEAAQTDCPLTRPLAAVDAAPPAVVATLAVTLCLTLLLSWLWWTRRSALARRRPSLGRRRPRRRHQLVATSRAAVRSHLGGTLPLHAFTMRGGLVQGAGLRSHPALPVQATATQ